MSARVSTSLALNSGLLGLMYSKVPITPPKPVTRVRSVSRSPSALATPKSITLTTGLPSEAATSTFVGLRSRWIMLFWWACWTASQTDTNNPRRSRGVSPWSSQ